MQLAVSVPCVAGLECLLCTYTFSALYEVSLLCVAGLGVPVMLAYVYGVVPISLCRSEGCGGSDEDQGEGVNGEDEVPEAVVVTTPHPGVKEADTQAGQSYC